MRAQLRHHEGLGEVVVGTGVEARHLLVPAVTRRQHQHGHVASRGAPALQHRQPVQYRQAEVQHHRVIGLGGAEEMPLFAVRGVIDDEAGLRQRVHHLPGQRRVILDDQDAHQRRSSTGPRLRSSAPVAASRRSSTTRPEGGSSLNS
jgi:hypothetical protein